MAEDKPVKELVDKDVTVFLRDYKLKGKVKLAEDETALSFANQGEFVELDDISIFDKEGSGTIARTKKLQVKLSEIVMYFLDEFVLPRAR